MISKKEGEGEIWKLSNKKTSTILTTNIKIVLASISISN
ncbi:hypothetical protein IGL98_000777 [Enterococcus sp. DIV0840]